MTVESRQKQEETAQDFVSQRKEKNPKSQKKKKKMGHSIQLKSNHNSKAWYLIIKRGLKDNGLTL